MKFRKIDPGDIDRRQIYRLLVGTIVPRPIAWVSTISAAGHVNLAPFSFFTCVSHAPPMVSISVGMRDETQKHTARNILETMGYVIHVVANGMEEQMNVCAGNYPPDVNEFEEAGLDAVPADLVPAPRIAAAPVAMECRFRSVITNGVEGDQTNLIIGEVIRWHPRGRSGRGQVRRPRPPQARRPPRRQPLLPHPGCVRDAAPRPQSGPDGELRGVILGFWMSS